MNEHLLGQSPTYRATVRKSQVAAAAAVLIGAGAVAVFIRSWVAMATGLVVAILSAAFTPGQTRLTVRKRTRAFLAELPKSHWEGTQRLEATDQGLTFASRVGTSSMEWSALERADVTPSYLILSFGGLSGCVVPRDRVLSGDLQAFAGVCRAAIAARGAS